MASIAVSSPIAVRTMTSREVRRLQSHMWLRLTGILFFSAEKTLDLLTSFTIRKLDIILGGAVIAHERKEAVISDIKLASS